MRRITAMGVAALLAFAGTARSQDSYPNRPIHIVVPSAAPTAGLACLNFTPVLTRPWTSWPKKPALIK